MQDIYLPALESVPLHQIIKHEYREYQIYTLMDRAIPYLRDGLKPSQRRILYTLWRNQSKGLLKVSAATGLVLTLHPHGPPSIESAIVNMAQDFTFANNYPLIDKKGYFGERMEPEPAASRYIECKIGKVAEILLFDDMNQVQMIPNYDEKVMEPLYLLPKLPIMLLNGSEGIGTGFSSVIPSFSHKDLVDCMISFIRTGKPKKLKPWVRNYSLEVRYEDKKRYCFDMEITQKGDKLFITELPRGYDSKRIYRYLNKFMEKDIIRDYIDYSVDNQIEIELVFKRGQEVDFEKVIGEISTFTSLVPNYTLISERGVKIFERPEEIVKVFTNQRLEVVKRRYELLIEDCEQKIQQNNEIIRFIKEKHYEEAPKRANRKAYVEYLKTKKFTYSDYLADMSIYRMTKDEVKKREMLVKEDSAKLKNYKKIVKSDTLVAEKLIEELQQVKADLSKIMLTKDNEKKKLYAKLAKKKVSKKAASKSSKKSRR
jgi:DNA gyrase subunit A